MCNNQNSKSFRANPDANSASWAWLCWSTAVVSDALHGLTVLIPYVFTLHTDSCHSELRSLHSSWCLMLNFRADFELWLPLGNPALCPGSQSNGSSSVKTLQPLPSHCPALTVLLGVSTCRVNSTLICISYTALLILHKNVLNMEFVFFASWVYSSHFFSWCRMEKNAWEHHERRMKEHNIMAFSDNNQQNLPRPSSQPQIFPSQHQRQVRMSMCFAAQGATIQKASTSSNCPSATIRQASSWLFLGWTWFLLEGRIKYEQS